MPASPTRTKAKKAKAKAKTVKKAKAVKTAKKSTDTPRATVTWRGKVDYPVETWIAEAPAACTRDMMHYLMTKYSRGGDVPRRQAVAMAMSETRSACDSGSPARRMTREQAAAFMANPSVNPVTGRTIKVGGFLHQLLRAVAERKYGM